MTPALPSSRRLPRPRAGHVAGTMAAVARRLEAEVGISASQVWRICQGVDRAASQAAAPPGHGTHGPRPIVRGTIICVAGRAGPGPRAPAEGAVAVVGRPWHLRSRPCLAGVRSQVRPGTHCPVQRPPRCVGCTWSRCGGVLGGREDRPARPQMREPECVPPIPGHAARQRVTVATAQQPAFDRPLAAPVRTYASNHAILTGLTTQATWVLLSRCEWHRADCDIAKPE